MELVKISRILCNSNNRSILLIPTSYIIFERVQEENYNFLP